MSRPAFVPAPPDPVLRPLLRARLGDLGLSLRVVAEDVHGLDATLDAVAVDPEGRAVVVMAGPSGRDLELIANAIAQRAWLRSHLPDWLKIAPQLGIRTDAPVRLLLLAPSFGPRALAAAQAADAVDIDLATFRCLRIGDEVEVLLEPVRLGGSDLDATNGRSAAPFRTGLSDADLGLTPAERRSFD